MRLIIPVVIILLGMGIGALVSRFFKNSAGAFRYSVIAGGFGAFAGIMIRDVLDINAGGDLAGASIAAIIGAAVLATITNVLFSAKKNL